MLVSHAEDKLQLVGYLSPFSDQDLFVLPVFRRSGGNSLCVQEIADDGTILEFREITPVSLKAFAGREPPSVQRGDDAIWGVVGERGGQHFATRAAVGQILSERLERIEDPLLRLQIAQFCGRDEALGEAWRSSFDQIAATSPRSAAAWRDVVVIPNNIRWAIESAVIRCGLEVPRLGLDRSVEVRALGDRLDIGIAADLHAAIAQNPTAAEIVKRRASLLRDAFKLPASTLRMKTVKTGRAPVQEGSKSGDVVVVAIGAMAFRLALTAYRHTLDADEALYQAAAYSLDPAASFTVFRDGEPVFHTLRSLDDLGRFLKGDTILVVVFPVTSRDAHLTHLAHDLASTYRTKGRPIVGVIPHLPETFLDPLGPGPDVRLPYAGVFDALWLLGDRSPSTRQVLPYGPARSELAAVRHFGLLLAWLRGDHGWMASLSRPTHNSQVSVIASAEGNRSIPSLTQHALMRLSHHMLDVTTAHSAMVICRWADPTSEHDIQSIINDEAPSAKATMHFKQVHSSREAHITLALHGVELRPEGPESFEKFCIDQLRMRGWQIDYPDGRRPMIYARQRADAGLWLQCKYVAETAKSHAFRPSSRRRREEDTVLITNAMIKRSTFARGVLNGHVPIHSSKSRRFPASLPAATAMSSVRSRSGALTRAVCWPPPRSTCCRFWPRNMPGRPGPNSDNSRWMGKSSSAWRSVGIMH